MLGVPGYRFWGPWVSVLGNLGIGFGAWVSVLGSFGFGFVPWSWGSGPRVRLLCAMADAFAGFCATVSALTVVAGAFWRPDEGSFAGRGVMKCPGCSLLSQKLTFCVALDFFGS